jgi:translocation and assembly module TamB
MNKQAPADLLVRAEAFPLEAVHPLVSSAVSKLGGVLDGDVRVQWHQVAAARDADLLAHLTLRDGVVHVPQLGQELSGVTAKIDGADGVLKVQDISASATTGRATGWLTARLDGLALRDLNGELAVAEGEDVPLTLEGVPLGTGHGRVTMHAVAKPDVIQLNLTGQGLRVVLPSSASQAVQPLGDNPDVEVAQLLGPARAKRAAEAVPWSITVALADTEIRGSGLRLVIASSPTAPPTFRTDDDSLSGELQLESGELDFLGVGSGLKLFVIDRGIVRFERDDAGNPYVNLTAHYDSPDGSTITAEYVGRLKPVTREKLRFSSSPPRTQEEIIALLLFGDTAAAQGASSTTTAGGARSPGSTGAAAGGGGIAAAQLNALLGGIAPLRGLSTSFGTTSEGYTSTGVSYQISDTVTAQAAYERRSSTAADATAASEGSADGGTGNGTLSRTRIGVDWRFYEDWLLRGSVGIGDQPTSGLDLMWQYRY